MQQLKSSYVCAVQSCLRRKSFQVCFSFSVSKLSLCSSSSRYFHKHQQPQLVQPFHNSHSVEISVYILRNIQQRGLDRIKANCSVFVFVVVVLLLHVEGPWSNCAKTLGGGFTQKLGWYTCSLSVQANWYWCSGTGGRGGDGGGGVVRVIGRRPLTPKVPYVVVSTTSLGRQFQSLIVLSRTEEVFFCFCFCL